MKKHKVGKKNLSRVSTFCGPLINRETKEPKMCDVCGTERAMWQHTLEDDTPVYLCFGCGDH